MSVFPSEARGGLYPFGTDSRGNVPKNNFSTPDRTPERANLVTRAFQALVVGATLFDSRFPGTSGSTPGSITRGR